MKRLREMGPSLDVLRLLTILTKPKVAAQIRSSPWTQKELISELTKKLLKLAIKRLLSELTKKTLRKSL